MKSGFELIEKERGKRTVGKSAEGAMKAELSLGHCFLKTKMLRL